MAGDLVTVEERYKGWQTLLYGENMQVQLGMALPRGVSAERYARLIFTEFRKSPNLLHCTAASVMGSVMEAAQLGLDIGSRGQAYLIPYKDTCTLVIGYRGMLDLAWRSTQIKSVDAVAVMEGDEFDFELGTAKFIKHKRHGGTEQRNITHAYAIVETIYGGLMFDVMDAVDIDAIRDRSRAKTKGPWVTDYPEMSKKSVLRRLLKLTPCSTELARAITLDEQAEFGIDQNLQMPIDVESIDETDDDKTEEE
jgi:recombination protein RecT